MSSSEPAMTSLGVPWLPRVSFRSRDAEETRAFMLASGFGFDLADGDAGQLDVRVRGVSMPGLYLGYTQYGSAALLRLNAAHPLYWITLPLRGHLSAVSRGDAVICDARHGAVLSPARGYQMQVEGGGARLNVALRRDAVARQLAALLGGDAPADPLDFTPALDLDGGYGQSIARFVHLAAAELDRPDSVLTEATTLRAFEEFMLTALLLSHPHNHVAALRRLERAIAPRDVKRAIDYMQANLDAPIGLPEIVAASGVAGRTLLKHFADFEGMSPMRYLRNQGFERVRAALRRAGPDGSVMDIAASLGFNHLGRFSVEYRQRFGERPSETLRRSGGSRRGD
jgi:AraC-like DNA-binding protein